MADIGTTATIAWTGGLTAQLTNIDWNGINRPSFKTSHMGTTVADTFIPGDLSDMGEWVITAWFDPDDDLESLISLAAATATITYRDPSPGGGGATKAASVFPTGIDHVVPLEDLMEITLTAKVSGQLTEAAAT